VRPERIQSIVAALELDQHQKFALRLFERGGERRGAGERRQGRKPQEIASSHGHLSWYAASETSARTRSPGARSSASGLTGAIASTRASTCARSASRARPVSKRTSSKA